MKITKELLLKHNACRDQVVLFDSLFHEGTDVTEESCLKALGAGIDFEWACGILLKDLIVYEASEKLLWNVYEAAEKPLLKEYNSARKQSRNDYEAGVEPLLWNHISNVRHLSDAHKSARKPLLEEYKKQQALLFCKQFNEENP